MVSPLASGLFYRAIGQSGGMFSGGPGLVNDLKSAESAGEDFARQMSSYWVNFSRSGDPNGEGLPFWPSFDPSSPRIIEFGNEAAETPLPFREQFEFLDRFNNR